ncbi:MAG: hypothetical protein WB729_16530 [Candidatus Sulfotelmatobacter sp.]
MVVQEMVTLSARKKISDVLSQVAEEKGTLRLAMLAQTSREVSGRWTLVVSAPWMDRIGPRAVISDLTARLLKHLDKRSLSAVDGVSVLSSSDPLVDKIVELLNDFLGVEVSEEDGGFYVSHSRIEDWDIPRAFVFVADPLVNGKARNPTSANPRLTVR